MPLDPVLQLPVEFLVVKLSISRLLILLSFLFYILLFFLNPLRYSYNKIFLFFYAWITYYLFSYFWSCGRLENILRNIFLLVFVSFVVLFSYVLERENLGKKTIKYIVFLSIFFALIEQIFGYRLPASRQHFFMYELTSFYINPAHLGASLALSFCWIVEEEYKSLEKGFYLSFLYSILIFFIILRTGTKGSLISFFVASLLFIISGLFKKNKKHFAKNIRKYFFFIILDHFKFYLFY
ncbi:MAG: hypothetical protein QXO40_03560 [Candidatus Aenigmatarchaeota archaeon]